MGLNIIRAGRRASRGWNSECKGPGAQVCTLYSKNDKGNWSKGGGGEREGSGAWGVTPCLPQRHRVFHTEETLVNCWLLG